MTKMFEKANIGSLKLRNRIFMAPMGTSTDTDGGYSERNINYFAARAKGGAGLIITGANAISDKYEPRPCHLLDDLHKVDRVSLLASRVHQHGAKLCVQITPGLGRVSFVDPFTPPYAPSEVSAFWFPSLVCKPFTVEQIQYLVRQFGYAASLAKQAGADAIEIHGYGGYLIDQFHSTLWNKRTDEYGGDLEGRTRFSRELIAEVRKTCGPDFPILFKFTPYHGIEGGRELEEGIELAKILEKAGVDALHVDMGCYEAWYSAITTVYQPHATQIHLAEAIKQAVSIPVLSQGKLARPEIAEQVLQEGKTDFVGLGHQMLADPEWVNKAAAGKPDDITPCIGCNECLLAGFSGRITVCAVNPYCSFEEQYKLEKSLVPKSVLIVGGGPGGMAAASFAAERGFQVELWEKQDRLGGNLLAAGAPAFKQDVLFYANHLIRKVSSHPNIQIRLGMAATADAIAEKNADLTIIAIGAREAKPPVQGIDRDQVVLAGDVLLDRVSVGANVVVIGGGLVGCETALHLHEQGKAVTLVEMQADIVMGDSHSLNNLLKLKAMLKESGIPLLTGTKLLSVEEKSVKLEREGSAFEQTCNSVVIAAGYKPIPELADAVEGRVKRLQAIGDCEKPGKILDAIHQAFHAVRLLEVTKEEERAYEAEQGDVKEAVMI